MKFTVLSCVCSVTYDGDRLEKSFRLVRVLETQCHTSSERNKYILKINRVTLVYRRICKDVVTMDTFNA